MNSQSYSSLELNDFKHILTNLKLQQEKQIERVATDIEEIIVNGKDEQQVVSTSYSSQLESLMDSKYRMVKHLKYINNALLRIENKTYGICAETGKKIPKERLLAVPITILSIEGKRIRNLKH